MSKFTKEMVYDYADKLLIGLTDEENRDILNEFKVIEENMNLINEIDGISNVEPMHYPFDIDVDLRDENKIENDNVDELLKNSDKINDREIEVVTVVE